MQNKLNEILELCVEKSDEKTRAFYMFSYNTAAQTLGLVKFVNELSAHNMEYEAGMINQALEYMQNE